MTTLNTNDISNFQIAAFDDRPFFEKALRYGVSQGLINDEKIQAINTEAPKGMVQIATVFGSPYLREELELARLRIVNLASLYLSESAADDLDAAARLIRDNTFLTLSRGGSSLLKELFALPEYPILGKYEHARVEDFIGFWSRKKTVAEYRDARQQRELYQLEIRLAKKLGKALGLSDQIFQEQHCEADSLIRTALLTGITNTGGQTIPSCFNQTEFARVLTSLRKKTPASPGRIDGDFSAAELDLLKKLHEDMVQHDQPLIEDPRIPLDLLIARTRSRYFILDHDIDDTTGYDALVSREWSRVTKGKSDIDAIFTLLLCIATNVPNKVSLTETGARTLIKKIRKDGFYPELASLFIQQHAPHEKQDSLLADWLEFCEQAQMYLLDDWDHEMHLAMRFLHDNCYIEKPGKKPAR